MSIRIPKITLIVPIYKAEKYLHRCIDSILGQTFEDFEVLLVDDGSPDRSGYICDEYARKDHRVRVFHKENGGVSSARQCGIDNAYGEYTIQVDPDDWVEPTMLEELYAKAKEDNSDMVICDFYEEYEHKQIYKIQKPTALEHNIVLGDFFSKLHASLCNKLIKRECYTKYNLRFPKEMNLSEDAYLMFCLTKNPIKITYLSKAYYHYDRYTNKNSITRKLTIKDLDSLIFLIKYLEENIEDKFKEEIYNKKCYVKTLAFSLPISYSEFIHICEDINERFIYENWEMRSSKKIRKLNLFIAFCMKTNMFIGRTLRYVYNIKN